MWNLFKHNKRNHDDNKELIIDDTQSIEQLNDYCYECKDCGEILELPDFQPLTIAKCTYCGTPFFVPYKIKDYWLYRPLGGGGMGSVYKAVSSLYQDKSYAVKILPRNKKNDPRLISALLKEAQIGHSFGRHPHLTYVENYGKYKDEYFSAMEFTEGMRLDQIINSHERISPKFVLLWALQILSAEQRMYDCGYLYRDLKPQNIIIDGPGNAHLIDYGLCVSLEEIGEVNASSSVEGSPLYMPPERIVGVAEDMASEIYSLGMVMFHALAKTTYYSADEAVELAKKHVASIRLARVKTRMSISVSPRVCRIIDKMIARQPKDRFLTYTECAKAIKEVYEQLDD